MRVLWNFLAIHFLSLTATYDEVAQLQAAVPSDPSVNVKEKKKPVVLQSKKKSQLDLLSGVIKPKRKRSGAACTR